MIASLPPVARALLDLGSLFLIWGGTVAITLVGIPALIMSALVEDDGSRLLDDYGRALVEDPNPDEVRSRRRYMRWAWFGVGLITIGMGWQGAGPGAVLSDAVQDWWRSRS